MKRSALRGMISDIQHYSLHDGPGIRTAIFLKGCPLRCMWCSNPESQHFNQEIGLIRSLCHRCFSCVEHCPQHAISINKNGNITLNRVVCTLCGTCIELCPHGARKLFGNWISLPEIMVEIEKDIPFYLRSGGGVTFSGGEPFLQWKFMKSVLEKCRERYIHTAIETCGYIPEKEVIESVLPLTDLILYDIKHMDTKKHEHFTGVSNDLVLENVKYTASSGAKMTVRIPVIPGFNNTMNELGEIGDFVQSLNGTVDIELLPYHEYGKHKYSMLERRYPLQNNKPYSPEELTEFRTAIQSKGINCTLAE